MILSALALSSAVLSAQENSEVVVSEETEVAVKKAKGSIMYRQGYRPDIELSWSSPASWGISTSQGYSFGNGLYLGGGTGFAAEFESFEMKDNPTYLVPVFADIKYSFINSTATPFVSLKAGSYVDVTNSGLRAYANPAVGLDAGRFSIKFGYEYQLGFWGHGSDQTKHCFKFGFGFTF